MKKAHRGFVLTVVSMCCLTGALQAEQSTPPGDGKPQTTSEQQDAVPKGKVMAALKKAAGKKRYLFVFFYKQNDTQTEKMRRIFDEATQKLSEKADAVAINIGDREEKAAVAKFDVSKAPMPLALAIAPNGAVTGGFPKEFDEAKLTKALVSPTMADCLKNLQDQKYVFVCIQSDKTKHNDSAMRGVRDFKADTKHAEDTGIVMLDPSKPEEVKTLQSLRVNADTAEAVTVFLAPPGSIVGRYNGATSKDQFVTALKSKMTSCAPGSGCCPKK